MLSKQSQLEIKERILIDRVNRICDKFREAKSSYNKNRCIELSLKLNELLNISIFDKCKYGYYDGFVEEVKAFKNTQKFVDIDYSQHNDFFGKIAVIKLIYG